MLQLIGLIVAAYTSARLIGEMAKSGQHGSAARVWIALSALLAFVTVSILGCQLAMTSTP